MLPFGINELPHFQGEDPLEVVRRPEGSQGFVLLPKRWVVERTLAWLNQNRRLSKDYEELPSTSETFVYVAMTRLMLKRLAA